MDRRALLAGAGAALLAVVGCAPRGGKTDLKSLAVGKMKTLKVADAPVPPPAFAMTGPDGQAVTLESLKGKVAVINLWATWCAPCKIEMPTLAALAKAYAGKAVAVIALSLDRDDAVPAARAFIAGLPPLAFHHADMGVAFEMKPPPAGFPTTLILDKQGRERARLPGDADWSSPEAKAVIDLLLAEAG